MLRSTHGLVKRVLNTSICRYTQPVTRTTHTSRCTFSTTIPTIDTISKLHELRRTNPNYEPITVPDMNIKIFGWVRSVRMQKTSCFISINDGTNFHGMQVIVDTTFASAEMFAQMKQLTLGSSVTFTGTLHRNERKDIDSAEAYELWATDVVIHNIAPSEAVSLANCPVPEYTGTPYPLQKKRQTLEYLRDIPAFKMRTNTYSAMMRVRSKSSFYFQEFFQNRDYMQVHAPIITPLDCEGAGEVFSVANPDLEQPYTSFFDTKGYLSVSGQLYAEIAAASTRKVFSFGPTFRAENSHTSRHLAEFWMLEPEITNANLQDICNECELSIKYVINKLLTHCKDDLAFFQDRYDKQLLDKLTTLVNSTFKTITYTEAIEILQNAVRTGHTFTYPVEWGCSLQSEHERYLAEQVIQGPVFITNYPISQKPFYMRINNIQDSLDITKDYNYKDFVSYPNPIETEPTVACMDLIVPGVGELCGGSQREERYSILAERMKEFNLPAKEYGWYLDTRRFGSIQHGGWGMGFERFLAFITGVENVRDTVLAPRAPKLMKV